VLGAVGPAAAGALAGPLELSICSVGGLGPKGREVRDTPYKDCSIELINNLLRCSDANMLHQLKHTFHSSCAVHKL
jgi:hypothetical protein